MVHVTRTLCTLWQTERRLGLLCSSWGGFPNRLSCFVLVLRFSMCVRTRTRVGGVGTQHCMQNMAPLWIICDLWGLGRSAHMPVCLSVSLWSYRHSQYACTPLQLWRRKNSCSAALQHLRSSLQARFHLLFAFLVVLIARARALHCSKVPIHRSTII